MSVNLPATPLLEVDLNGIQENYRYMRTLSVPKVTDAAVIKSDAYGLGLVPVARALADVGCLFFFVADLEEAVKLRAACPQASIAVFRGDLGKNRAVYERYALIPVLNALDEVRLMARIGPTLSFLLHVDTGLTRLGLCPSDVISLYLAGFFVGTPILGVLSHLACSAEAEDPTNELQRNRFAAIYNLLGPCYGSLVGSAGVWLGERYHFDMVRLGSALFGLNDPRVKPNPLRSVLRLSAPVVEVREVPSQEAVGYGATFRTQRSSRIAVIGLGYRHGLPWACANKIGARLGDFVAPVVGRLSMEYLTLDVTEIPESVCHVGAWVSLLDQSFGADDMADAVGVPSQEIVLRLGACCHRRFSLSESDLPAEIRAAS